MSKSPADRLFLLQPSRRDVQRVAEPGSLVLVYDDLIVFVLNWVHDFDWHDTSVRVEAREKQHFALCIVWDPSERWFSTRHFRRDLRRPQQVHWTTMRGWLFGQDGQLSSEVITAADPER